MALDPQAKHESPSRGLSRGTRLRRLATVAAPRSLDPDAFRRDLLSLVAFDVAIGRTRLDWVDADDLVQEARTWGMGTSRARATVERVLGATWEAALAVGLPERAESVLVNLEQLWSRRSWRPASA